MYGNSTGNTGNNHVPSLEECASALDALDPNCDRENWVRIGMALKNGLGEGGFQTFDIWSAGGNTYNPRDTRDVWRSISMDGGVTLKTLFKMARDAGWRGHAVPPNDRFDCQSLLQRCGHANPRHPYLVAKGIGSHGIRQLGNLLVIPLQDERGMLTGLQKIAADGNKRYHPGTRKRESFHLIGGRLADLGGIFRQQGKSLIVCEGFATGATLWEAMGNPVVVAFDAGNVLAVTTLFSRLFADIDIILAADDDWRTPGNPGLTKAVEAARATGARLAVPGFGTERQEGETDFNDLARRLGLDAVRRHIQDAKRVEAPRSERVAGGDGAGEPNPFSMADLLSLTFDPVAFTVDNLLAQGVYILGGKPKVGKSWMALHLLLSVAYGDSAFGNMAVNKGQALYISLEDHKHRLFKRVKQVCAASPSTDLFFEIQWPRLGHGCVEALDKWLASHPETKLVVFDTLARIRAPRKNNDDLYASDYALVSAFKEISERHKTTVILVHHLRKMGSDDPADMLSGTTGLAGGVDGTLILVKTKGGKTLTLHRSGRDLREDEPLILEWDKERGTWTCLDEKSAILRNITGDQQAVIDILAASVYPMTPKEVAEEWGRDSDKVRKLMARMVDNGLLLRTEATYGARYMVAAGTHSSRGAGTRDAHSPFPL
ncbi:MAG: AAA family ATPase [Magnetococcales bacterium]|nr:AAA family ATPase [Magnetococcales bacterium]